MQLLETDDVDVSSVIDGDRMKNRRDKEVKKYALYRDRLSKNIVTIKILKKKC